LTNSFKYIDEFNKLNLMSYEDAINTKTENENNIILNKNEKDLEDFYNNWDNLTNKDKFMAFLLFSKDFASKSLPISFIFLIMMMPNIVNLIFASHTQKQIDKELLAGVGLASNLNGMIGVSIGFGIASGLDTLCSQAYGSKMFYLMGCYLNRARIVISILFIPIFFVLFFAENFLLLIKQNPIFSRIAGEFCRGVLPGLWFLLQSEAQKRFLQSQGIYISQTICIIICNFIHPLWVYLYLEVFDLGAFGIGLATSTTNIIYFIILTIIAKYKSIKGSFFMINSDSFKGLIEFLKISIPCCIEVCLEGWTFQIITLLCGYLDEIQLNSQIILSNIGLCFYMIPFGISIASSIIVGKYVGRYSIKAIEKVTNLIILYSLIISIISLILIGIFRSNIIELFVHKIGMIHLLEILMIYWIIFSFFQFQVGTIAGLFKGLSLVKWNAIAHFVLIIINLPLFLLLTYKLNYQIYGTRTSFIISEIIVLSLYIIIFCKKVDYDKICKNSEKSLNNDLTIITQKAFNDSSITQEKTEQSLLE